jgi:hypothetical protein
MAVTGLNVLTLLIVVLWIYKLPIYGAVRCLLSIRVGFNAYGLH